MQGDSHVAGRRQMSGVRDQSVGHVQGRAGQVAQSTAEPKTWLRQAIAIGQPVDVFRRQAVELFAPRRLEPEPTVTDRAGHEHPITGAGA